jgi:hypothetical protein
LRQTLLELDQILTRLPDVPERDALEARPVARGEERGLRTWDLFHCPPQTEHVIVGAGDGPAVVLAVGARGRGRKGIVYPVSKVAQKHGAGVKEETTKPGEAYADVPKFSRCEYRDGWLPEP